MKATEPTSRVAVPVRIVRAEGLADPRALCAEADGEPLTVGSAEGNALRLADPTVSRFHLELSGDAGGIRVRDLGSTNGTRASGIRIVEAVVPSGTTVTLGDSSIRVTDGGVRALSVGPAIPGLVGSSPPARLLAARIERAAVTDAPVLVTGESGTGKEVVARALHTLSARAGGPFVVVDAGAVAAALVESELFGHERGAFTGAREPRAGAFERARGGTLFIDEVGELPAALQPMLLGALARGVIRRVGGDHDIAIDVRIVTATHRDLRAAVNADAFRPDLYHRIAVLRLGVPPLRARADDIPALVDAFLVAAGHDGPRAEVVPDAVLDHWCAHPWPGNVRELRNAVEAALALREPPELESPVGHGAFAEILGQPFRPSRDASIARFEARYLRALLEAHEGNVAAAARGAGIDRTYLHECLRRHGLR
ncbi:MAG: sigma 54-interacting transcriptional regulator [Sandaracinaceae bacterium]